MDCCYCNKEILDGDIITLPQAGWNPLRHAHKECDTIEWERVKSFHILPYGYWERKGV